MEANKTITKQEIKRNIISIILKNLYVLNEDAPDTGECLQQWDCIKLSECIDELEKYFDSNTILDSENGECEIEETERNKHVSDFTCSNCKKSFDLFRWIYMPNSSVKFCPNCGAKIKRSGE